MGLDAMILVFWMLSFTPAGSYETHRAQCCQARDWKSFPLPTISSFIWSWSVWYSASEAISSSREQLSFFQDTWVGTDVISQEKKPVCCICYGLNSFTILTWLKSAWLHETQASHRTTQRRGESGKGREHTRASSFAEELISSPCILGEKMSPL